MRPEDSAAPPPRTAIGRQELGLVVEGMGSQAKRSRKDKQCPDSFFYGHSHKPPF